MAANLTCGLATPTHSIHSHPHLLSLLSFHNPYLLLMCWHHNYAVCVILLALIGALCKTNRDRRSPCPYLCGPLPPSLSPPGMQATLNTLLSLRINKKSHLTSEQRHPSLLPQPQACAPSFLYSLSRERDEERGKGSGEPSE